MALSPREVGGVTEVDISLAWLDREGCDGDYLVALYGQGGSVRKFFGYHPAPETTSLEVETNLQWDHIAGSTHTVRVSCAHQT